MGSESGSSPFGPRSVIIQQTPEASPAPIRTPWSFTSSILDVTPMKVESAGGSASV